MIAYVLGVIGVAALLAVLGRAAVGLRTPRGARVTRVEPEPAAAPSANPNDVDDAATLAAAGRYAEAVHALLLRAIAVLRALAPAPPLPASLTSREIVGNCQQSAASRDALAGIVACVEVSRFGGEPLASSDFDRCETLYRRFRDGLGVAG